MTEIRTRELPISPVHQALSCSLFLDGTCSRKLASSVTSTRDAG